MSQKVRMDMLPRLRQRYAGRGRQGKSLMIDELCEQFGYSRKHAIKLLNAQSGWGGEPGGRRGRPPKYEAATVEVLLAHGADAREERPWRDGQPAAYPLCIAASRGYADLLQKFLALDERPAVRQRALVAACARGFPAAAALLLDQGVALKPEEARLLTLLAVYHGRYTKTRHPPPRSSTLLCGCPGTR